MRLTRAVWQGWASAWLVAAVCMLQPWLLAVADAKPSTEQQEVAGRLLILESMRPGLPVADAWRTALIGTLIENGISRSDILIEHLDADVNSEPAYQRALLRLLRRKFAHNPMALIIAVQRPAYEILARDGADFFPDVPVLAYAGNVNDLPPLPRPYLRLPERGDARATIDLALHLLPGTRRVVVVVGADSPILSYAQELKTELSGLASPPSIEFTDRMPYPEMLALIAALPPDSIVLFSGAYHRDVTGQSFFPLDVAKRVAQLASAPVFGLWDTHIQQGFLGGRAIDTLATARLAAKLSLDQLSGRQGLPASISSFPGTTTDLFDWQQMQRWRVAAENLPAGATLLNKPLPLWQKYPHEVFSGVLAMLLLGTLIILMIYRRQGLGHAADVAPAADGVPENETDRAEALEAANRHLAMLSFTDELTGLANRRRLDYVLANECLRANRSGHPLSLVMVDIDHFKDFNDTYGHLAGDECLKAVGEILAGISQRPADLATRYGGEEFLLILPETPHSGALERAQKFRAAIAARALPHRTSKTASHLTCSIGVLTAIAPPAHSPRELLTAVDMQLYQAKNSGRNGIHAIELGQEQAGMANESLVIIDAEDPGGPSSCTPQPVMVPATARTKD